jgi:hypothetical protein
MSAIRLPSVNTIKAAALRGVDGARWYETARHALQDLAAREGLDYDDFILAVAATSPRCVVWMNIRHALRVCRFAAWRMAEGVSRLRAYTEAAVKVPGLMGSIRKSLVKAIKAGVEALGPKTGPFASNLLGDETRVTLDSWMARFAGVPQSKLPRSDVGPRYTKRVVKVARDLGWSPAMVQAAVWRDITSREGNRDHGEQDWSAIIRLATAA